MCVCVWLRVVLKAIPLKEVLIGHREFNLLKSGSISLAVNQMRCMISAYKMCSILSATSWWVSLWSFKSD